MISESMHTHPLEPHGTLNRALSSVARILDSVILGAEASTQADLKKELIASLDKIMNQFKAPTLIYHNDGRTYEIHRNQKPGEDITVHGIIRIDLSTFVCTYNTNPGTTLFEGEHDESGTINFVENGRISKENIDFVLRKIGINANNGCCIS